jgi:hypothetical protein
MRIHFRIASAAVVIEVLAIASGCGKKLQSLSGLANQPPTVALTGAPLGSAKTAQVPFALHWTGSDPDGRVDHYLVTDNPRLFKGTEGWTRADETSRMLVLGRAAPAGEPNVAPEARAMRTGATPADAASAPARLPDPTFFAVRAVDDQGAVSEPAIKSFMGTDEAPSVIIFSPIPSRFNVASVGTTVRIGWSGYDPIKPPPYHLARFRFKLIAESDPNFAAALSDPDSIRREYAPDFAGWSEAPGDSLGHTYTGLPLYGNFIFALVGFNDAGVYTPIFSFGNSLLRMRVTYITTGGPVFTVYGDTFRNMYRMGGFFPDTAAAYHEDVLGTSTRLGWHAQAAVGSSVTSYRWAVDIADPLDETPRRNALDVRHWSRWSLAETSAVVSMRAPQPSSTRRFLYTEAISNTGLLSLEITRIDFRPPTFDQPLLIVNDTRRALERVTPGQVQPMGAWPNVAELDSFLFARGGVPIQGYPAGSISSPGIFSSYEFDVFDTGAFPTKDTVPLAELLSRYRSVVWITDGEAAGHPYSRRGSLLWLISLPGEQNTLEAYVIGGGRLWLAGGGAAYAASISAFNNQANDVGELVYSSTDGELRPGSFMFDVPRWQSELRSRIHVQYGAYATGVLPVMAAAPVVGTPRGGHGPFPAVLELRDPSTDPLPPLRTPADFTPNPAQTDIEYLSLPNSIVGSGRDFGGGHESVRGNDRGDQGGHGHGDGSEHGGVFSLLDTIYTCAGLPPDPSANYPCMTVYHGPGKGDVVFTGFDVWTWKRSQMVAMVDAILGDMWHQGRGHVGPPHGDDDDKVAGEALKRRR